MLNTEEKWTLDSSQNLEMKQANLTTQEKILESSGQLFLLSE
jgi:hypothetical protein